MNTNCARAATTPPFCSTLFAGSAAGGYGGEQQPDARWQPPPPVDRACNNYTRPQGCQNIGNHLTGRPTSRVLAPPGGRSSVVLGGGDARPAGGAHSYGYGFGYGAAAAAPFSGGSSYRAGSSGGSYGRAGSSGGGARSGGGGYTSAAERARAAVRSVRFAEAPATFGCGAAGASTWRDSPPRHHAPAPAPAPLHSSLQPPPPPGTLSVGAWARDGNNYAREGGCQNTGNWLTDRRTCRVLAPPGGASSVVLG